MKNLKISIGILWIFSVLFSCNSIIAQEMMVDNGQNIQEIQIQSTSTYKTGWCTDTPPVFTNLESERSWPLWGGDLRNRRAKSSGETRLTAEQIPSLQLAWAFAVPEIGNPGLMRSQPAVAGDWLYLAAMDGSVRALHAKDGCVIWKKELDAPLFSGTTLSRLENGGMVLVTGDLSANVYALDPFTGERLWSRQVSDHETARISGTPVPFENRIYVPVSSGEWATDAGGDPEYECCTFRGKVVALNASNGEILWEYHTIDDPPVAQGENEIGTTQWGPSGAGVWSSVTVDTDRGRLYVGTGNNYSYPSTETSSAIHAINMETGEREWIFQGTEKDIWIVTCMDQWVNKHNLNTANCPEDHGPDFDFGAAPMLTTLKDGRDILIAGQKSGIIFGLDPDREGEVIWKTRVGRGGILGGVHFGMALHKNIVLVPVSDRDDGETYEHARKSGVVGLDVSSGKIIWSTPALSDSCDNREGCHSGFSAPATATPGAVLAGALDGHLQAFSVDSGKRIWSFDTVRSFKTVNGEPGRGGAMSAAGPVVTDDMIYVLSGYGGFAGQMPGNVLLAFSMNNYKE